MGSVQKSLFPLHSSEPGICQFLCFSKLLSIPHFSNQLIIQLTVCLDRGKPKLLRISPTSLQVNSINIYHSPAGFPNAGGVGRGGEEEAGGVSPLGDRPVPSLGYRASHNPRVRGSGHWRHKGAQSCALQDNMRAKETEHLSIPLCSWELHVCQLVGYLKQKYRFIGRITGKMEECE